MSNLILSNIKVLLPRIRDLAEDLDQYLEIIACLLKSENAQAFVKFIIRNRLLNDDQMKIVERKVLVPNDDSKMDGTKTSNQSNRNKIVNRKLLCLDYVFSLISSEKYQSFGKILMKSVEVGYFVKWYQKKNQNQGQKIETDENQKHLELTLDFFIRLNYDHRRKIINLFFDNQTNDAENFSVPNKIIDLLEDRDLYKIKINYLIISEVSNFSILQKLVKHIDYTFVPDLVQYLCKNSKFVRFREILELCPAIVPLFTRELVNILANENCLKVEQTGDEDHDDNHKNKNLLMKETSFSLFDQFISNKTDLIQGTFKRKKVELQTISDQTFKKLIKFFNILLNKLTNITLINNLLACLLETILGYSFYEHKDEVYPNFDELISKKWVKYNMRMFDLMGYGDSALFNPRMPGRLFIPRMPVLG